MNAAALKNAFPNASPSFLEANASKVTAGDSVRKNRIPWSDEKIDFQDDPYGPWVPPACSTIKFTVMGNPIGKPRMTQRDKWAKRPCVLRYREWADKARASAPKDLPQSPNKISLAAYLPFPKSYKEKKRKELQGKPHRLKPDADNILKGIDSLWSDDSAIWSKHIEKFWDDGLGPRIEIEVTP